MSDYDRYMLEFEEQLKLQDKNDQSGGEKPYSQSIFG